MCSRRRGKLIEFIPGPLDEGDNECRVGLLIEDAVTLQPVGTLWSIRVGKRAVL